MRGLRAGYKVALDHHIDGKVCPFVHVIDIPYGQWIKRSDRPLGWGPHSVYTRLTSAMICANNPWWGARPGKYYEIWQVEYMLSEDTQLRLKGPDGWVESFGRQAEAATGIRASDIAYAEKFRLDKFVCRVRNLRCI